MNLFILVSIPSLFALYFIFFNVVVSRTLLVFATLMRHCEGAILLLLLVDMARHLMI